MMRNITVVLPPIVGSTGCGGGRFKQFAFPMLHLKKSMEINVPAHKFGRPSTI
jgi:hypothetical protein